MIMNENDVIVTQSDNPSKDVDLQTLPDSHSPVGIIIAIAILIGAITKLLQVLVPVMMREQNR